MLYLNVLQDNNDNATIQIVDHTGECRADVYVEIRGDGVERPLLVVTDNIKARDSGDPTLHHPLLEQEPKDELGSEPKSVTLTALNDTELGTVLAALRYYQRSLGTLPRAIVEIAGDAGEALDVDEIDDLCERLNTGG